MKIKYIDTLPAVNPSQEGLKRLLSSAFTWSLTLPAPYSSQGGLKLKALLIEQKRFTRLQLLIHHKKD